MEIKDKVIIITGGTGGIATATVNILLERHAKYVALFDLKKVEDRGRSMVEKFEEEFGKGRVGFFINDVRDHEEFEEKFDEIIKIHKNVDILINNAGILNDTDPALEIDINYKALVMCTLTAIDRMGSHHNGKGGTIVQISSVGGLRYHQKFPIYVGTKHAVIGFACSLKGLHETHNIRTLTLCPGLTKTGMVEQRKTNILDIFNHIPDLAGREGQSPKSVGFAIAELIEKGKSGDIWIVENDELPCALEEEKSYKERKIPIS